VSEWFERRVAAALHADVPLGTDERARQRVMERVRVAAAEGHPVRRAGRPWHRLARHSLVGLSFAAGIGGISTLSAIVPSAQRDMGQGLSSVVLGDTVVATLRDTLRLVRLMFDAPDARRVAVAGDFNRWNVAATPLARDERTQRWSVTLALREGEHRYAFVVDGTRWVPDPRAERSVRGANGRIYSLLSLSRTAN
jgi:Glycogen recognition site of AMP-activated protein kinase